MTNRIFAAVAVLVMGVALAACAGGRTRVESDLAIKGAPDWVNEGVQALDNRGGRLIHGIGSAPKMPDASLQRTTADDRARAEVARVLSSFMNVVSQDYIASAGYGDGSVEERAISRQIDNLTRLNMSGTEIIARWQDRRKGDVWSLAELDLKRVQEIVRNSNLMNEGFVNHLEMHGETLFDRFINERN